MHTPHLNLAARIQCPLLHQALMEGGLVTARIHQSLICTPLNTHRYLVMPGLIGGSPRGVGDPDQQSHLHHGTVVLEMPGVPASPADRPRPYRRPSGRRKGKGLPEREGRWWCCVLCSPPSPGVSKEGLAHPGARHQVVLRQLNGLHQRRRAVALDSLGGSTGQPSDELFQHHQIDDSLDVARLGHEIVIDQRDQRATSLAPQVALAGRVAWWRAGFLVPGFQHQCSKVRVSREGRRGSQG